MGHPVHRSEREAMNESVKSTRKNGLRNRLSMCIPRSLLVIPCALLACLATASWTFIQGIGDEADDGMIVLRCPNPLAVREAAVATARATREATPQPAVARQ